MVHTFPGAQYVRVDALWGYPDGLLHYAHDTSFYYPEEGRINTHIRYKGVCLLPKSTDWTTVTVAPPLDWQQVLADDEIKTVGDWALRLANGLHQQVQLMVLARIGGNRGPAACLPWHYTAFEIPQYTQSLRALPEYAGIEIISTYGDLDRLQERNNDETIRGYQIRPAESLLRDDKFLIQAATLAFEHQKPLYFEGSLLGHAYYVMDRTGATVIPVVDEPKQIPKVYHKLVRDHIPIVVRQAGGLARVRRVPRTQAKMLLTQKLIEEAFEARNASQSDLVEELADILDVVEALQSNLDIDPKALAAARDKKKARRGGFHELMYLEETNIRPLKMTSGDHGRLPLFGEDPQLPPRTRRSHKADFVRIERSDGQNDLARFSISLVPPAAGGEIDVTLDMSKESRNESHRSPGSIPVSSVQPHFSKVRLAANYVGSRVTVRLVRLPELDRTDQLTLPFLDVNRLDK
jgi:predicted house-cleaning noncanonical NTP pyrophosphatase (MazG superfamily)